MSDINDTFFTAGGHLLYAGKIWPMALTWGGDPAVRPEHCTHFFFRSLNFRLINIVFQNHLSQQIFLLSGRI
jgi:hypothetical protein